MWLKLQHPPSNSAYWLQPKVELNNGNKMNYQTQSCSSGVASGTLVY